MADTYYKCIFVYDRKELQKDVIDLAKLKVNGVGALTIDTKRHRILLPDIRNHRILMLDYSGNPETTGKDAGRDRDKTTFVNLCGIDGARSGDTLQRERFTTLTRSDALDRVLAVHAGCIARRR